MASLIFHTHSSPFGKATKSSASRPVPATTPRQRDIADFLASYMIGVAATRVEYRLLAATGL